MLPEAGETNAAFAWIFRHRLARNWNPALS